MKDRRKNYSEREKRDHVRACLERIQQGRTIKSYVAEQEFSQSAMNEWLRRYRDQVTINQNELLTTSLVQVKHTGVSPIMGEQTSSLKVNAGPVSIELPAGNSDSDLKRILFILREVL